ncbi:PREDICTED: dual specificity phosphatase 28 [Myotis davidii]|uniref:dual specificity phosphatase 28 n=1 Tax=Myotis davidii TaxID=225400 RepID=UPI000767D6EA|nr:PREDICTED: dual specificity phosphatase 28 [Myotis davidii]
MDSGGAERLGGGPATQPPLAHVAPSLFLGNARTAAASELLACAGVTLCVNVSRQQPGPRAPGVAELRVPVFDDPAEDLLAHLDLQTVKSARPVAEPNPGFWSQLQKYEEGLQSRSRLTREPSTQ